MFRKAHSRRGSAATAIIVILVLALIGGGVWYFVLRSTPEKTVGNLLEAARIGEDETMKDYLTEASRTDGGLVLGLTRRLVGDPTGEPEYTIGEPVIADGSATVPVEFPVGDTIATLTGRETFTVPYVLRKEGRTWLVDTADTREEIGRRVAGGALDTLRRFITPGGGSAPAPDGQTI
jgi:hypothetical protein